MHLLGVDLYFVLYSYISRFSLGFFSSWTGWVDLNNFVELPQSTSNMKRIIGSSITAGITEIKVM